MKYKVWILSSFGARGEEEDADPHDGKCNDAEDLGGISGVRGEVRAESDMIARFPDGG